MSHGGYRRGAGRKTNAQINIARTILDETMTKVKWQRLFTRLNELALKGNVRAAQLLLTYRFGDPNAEPEKKAEEVQEIRTIVVSGPCPHCGRHPNRVYDDDTADVYETDDSPH